MNLGDGNVAVRLGARRYVVAALAWPPSMPECAVPSPPQGQTTRVVCRRSAPHAAGAEKVRRGEWRSTGCLLARVPVEQCQATPPRYMLALRRREGMAVSVSGFTAAPAPPSA